MNRSRLILFLAGLILCSSCSTKAYLALNYADFDPHRGDFRGETKLTGGIFCVSAKEYILVSEEIKSYMRKIKLPSQVNRTTLTYVLHNGSPCRVILYEDDGYYNKRQVSMILYSLAENRPLYQVWYSPLKKVERTIQEIKADPKIARQIEEVSQQAIRASRKSLKGKD